MNKRIHSSADIDRDMRKAMLRAARTMKKYPELLATMESAGFLIPPRYLVKTPRAGLQVFVKLVRFDEALLAKHPDTGGLLIYSTNKQIKHLHE